MDERRKVELRAKAAELRWFIDNNRDFEPYDPSVKADLRAGNIKVSSKNKMPEDLKYITEFMDERVIYS